MKNREFVDKVVVVTGGAKGIGACVVDVFLSSGARVAFSDCDAKAGKWRQKLLRQKYGLGNGEVLFIRADMGKEADVRRFISTVLSRFQRADVLINNAGMAWQTRLQNRPVAEWDRVLSVNLKAAYLCSQLLAKSLSRTGGSIIHIASTRALMSEPDTEPYSASKGGLLALTHSLAVTLGKHGVRVNCVSPGWIDTSAWQVPPKKAKLTARDHSQHPAGRVVRPEDIAQACLFLASGQKAGFITGQNLVADGGMTIKMIYEE